MTDPNPNLVKTGTPPTEPKKFPYVMLKKGADEISAAEERISILMRMGASVNMLTIKYALYLSEEIIRADTSVFTGPKFPFMFAWISNGSDDISNRNRSNAIMKGYRPLDIRDERFQDKLVVGEEAVLMGIDRSTSMLLQYKRVKSPVPPALPEKLADCWGFALPPVVQPDGGVVVAGRKLYFTEVAAIEERRELKRKSASRIVTQDQPNFLMDEGSGHGRMEEVSIDM